MNVPDHLTDEAMRRVATTLIEAVESGKPKALVYTPGCADIYTPLDEYLGDAFAGKSDTLLAELIGLWAQCLRHPEPSLRIQAQSMLAALNVKHLEYHADDAVIAAMDGYAEVA